MFREPRWADRGDLLSHEQQLEIGNGTTPDPTETCLWVWRATGTKPQMLFEEAKHVFNGKAPKIHLREVAERNSERACPKEQKGTFEARSVVSLTMYRNNRRVTQCEKNIPARAARRQHLQLG